MNDVRDIFWQAYLVNFLFWSGLAQGAVALAATLDITNARWGREYVRIARALSSFLPVCVILFAILLIGRSHIFPWITEPVPEKSAYLNVPFLAVRGLVGLALLAFLSRITLARMDSAEVSSTRPGASRWSVALVIAFAVIYSYLAFDLIMSLEPHWYSTLLGAHYAFGSFYLGTAALCFVGCLRAEVPKEDRHKLAKLMFGFSPFWISLLWSQYVVIWYGDIPEETHFVYHRFYHAPWTALTIAVLVLAFVLPFVALMSRRAKLMGALQLIASFSAIMGLFLERHLLIVPSLSPDNLNIGWMYLLVTAAFAVLFSAIYRFSMGRMASP
jgi:Ni/Fe-hydrogenase subunit HybB-like protein